MQIICFILNNLVVCGFMEFHPLFSNLCIFIYLYYSSVIFLTFVVSDLNILTTQAITFMYIELFMQYSFIYHLMGLGAGSVGQLLFSFGGVGNLYLPSSLALLLGALSISSIFSKNSFLLISIFPYWFSSFTFALTSTINLYYFLPFLCFGFVLLVFLSRSLGY